MSVTQVGLGEQGGAIGLAGELGAGAGRGGQRAGDRLHPPHALALTAELAVIDHPVEPGDARGQGGAPVLVEEELGVGQARPDDPLVAFDHPRGIGRRDVADDQEAVRQRAGRVEQRKVLLVRLHRQDQALGRDLEELGIELAGEHVRPLDQRRHLVEQGGVVEHDQLGGVGRGDELADDLGAALGEAGDDRALVAQLGGVAAGVAQLDPRPLRLEPVALGDAAGVEAERRDRHDLAPCSATRPCAGRTNSTVVQPSASWYCMTLGIGRAESASSSAPCSPAWSELPVARRRRNSDSALPSPSR